MDSTLPHFKDSRERLLDLYWTRECYLKDAKVSLLDHGFWFSPD